uniref:Uncharacterized protein n=1 Tax=Micrurus surinamensis TaxID=129470 RepID=A0A2D4P9G4_MICSU
MPSQSSRGSAGGCGCHLMDGHRQASDEVQEFGKVQLPVRVDVQLFHHTVDNAWIFLVLGERGQLCVHEYSEFFLGERLAVSFLPSVALEDGQQRLDATLSFGGTHGVPG